MEESEKETTNTNPTPKPHVLSVNICDAIIRDEETKKVSLIGLFNIISANHFPCIHPQMYVYVALTNGHGKYKTKIHFVNLEDSEMIAGMEGQIEFASPLQVVEVNIRWQNLKFRKPGEYEVEVLCDGTRVGARKFIVAGQKQNIPPTSQPNIA